MPGPIQPKLPHIILVLWTQTLLGFAIAALFLAGLLAFDVGGLWRLVSTVPGGFLAAFLFWMLNGSVFAAAQFGIAIMTLKPAPQWPDASMAATLRPSPIPAVSRDRRG